MTKGVNELSLEMVWLRPESDCLGQADGWEMAPAPFSRSMSPRAAGVGKRGKSSTSRIPESVTSGQPEAA